MATQLFSGWELWQKLVFCLACAIVVTVILGGLKLTHTHRTLRKFTKLAEEERRDQEAHNQQTQMLQRQAMGRSDEKEVAFGIRAIEGGVKVEGVWISPSSTPRKGSAVSSPASSIREQASRQDFDVDLEAQNLRQGRSRSVSVSTIGTARTHDRAISLDRGVSAQSSRSASSEDSPIARPSRSRHPPSSYVRYSCNPYLIRQSTSINTLEGLEAIHKASTSIHGQNGDYSTSSSDSSNQSSNGGNDIEAIAASAPTLFTAQPRPRPRPRHSSSTDLEMLNKHRTSQAAEMGQLTPRVKRGGPNLSLDIKHLPTTSRASTSDTQLDYFGPAVSARPPSSAEKSPENPFSPAVESPSSTSTPRRSSMPDVTPFTQFCQKAPRPNSRPPTADSGGGAGGNRDSVSIYETPPASPIMPASDGAAALNLPSAITLPPSKRTSFDIKSELQVLRGHGSGFEILRPGSLNPKLPAPAVTKDSMEKTRPTPPLSLHNNMRPQSRRSSSTESGNKLQKKRRSSVSPNSFDSTSSAASRRSRMSGIL